VVAVVTDARRTARNAGWLIVQRGLHVATAAVFGLLVPRLMGPEVFGRYALLTSVSAWFAVLSGLGAVSLMSRVVPQFTATGDTAGLGKLVTNLLPLRAATGIVIGLAYFAIIAALAGDVDRVAAALIGAAVFCRTVGNICFSLFLGLNQAARWGLGDLARRMLTLGGVLAGYPIAGLRGACAGFLAANVIVLIAGLVGARPYLRWSQIDLRREYLGPFLKIGASFAAGNLLLALAQRSGETIVRVASDDYAQVGFFGAAYNAYFTGAYVLWQGSMAFAPLLVTLQHRDGPAAVSAWLGRLLKWMIVAASLVALATVLVADDLVPRILGTAFTPAATNVRPLAASIFMLAVCCVGRLGALVADRPWLSAGAAASELAMCWGSGLLLAPRFGSTGMACATLLGTATYAAVITWRTRDVVGYSPRAAIDAAALVVPWLLLAFFRGGPLRNAALLGVASAGYLALLRWRGVITVAELRALREVVRGGRQSAAPAPL
jgi:O-antigen/teichoic acid export membrane protein